MSEKQEKDDDKKEKKKNPDLEITREVIKMIQKLKEGNRLLYKTKSKFAPRKSKAHKMFQARVKELTDEGKSVEEIAILLPSLGLQLDVIERKILQKEKDPEPTEEQKQELEKFKKDAEVKIAEEQKAFIEKRAKGQKKVREKARERAADELETTIKQTEERVRKEEREIADKKIALMMKELDELKNEEKQKLTPEKGTLPRGIETVLDVAPSVARMAGIVLAPRGMGPSVGKLAQSVTASGASALGNLLRSEPEQAIKEKDEKDSKEDIKEPDTKTVLEIGATGYTPQAIPQGLKKFMTNVGVYASIYSRLNSEQKSMLRDVDQGMLILKQALTRTPVKTASSKTYHSAVGTLLNRMNREMDNPEDIKNNIQQLEKTLENVPDEIKNVIAPIDNALRVGYGQVVEMKRSGNILQPLVETARNEILELEPQEIMEAFNSVMRNATEVDLGGQTRVEPRERKIPQVGMEQARQIQQIVRGTLETDAKSDPLFGGEPETKKTENIRDLIKVQDSPDKEPDNKEQIRQTTKLLGGSLAAKLAYDTLPEIAKNIYNNIMETPIAMPETQAQSDQKISAATGTMRPRFIVPARDSVIPSMPKIRADDIQFSAFDYVPPGTEGGNGTARTNPLVLSQELEERLRYSNAGITISTGFGENVVSMILTESELKALLLPRGPEVSPVIYEFPIIDGDQSQNETKRYDHNLIQVEKFSPYNEYNDNDQLDEEVFGSILLSYVP